jgi:hypothetical protein
MLWIGLSDWTTVAEIIGRDDSEGRLSDNEKTNERKKGLTYVCFLVASTCI